MNYLVIIPARGGSKGILKKNIVDVLGKPLIHYTIQTAKNIKKKFPIKKIIVSTDSDEIASYALSEGIEVPFIRPTEISGDKAKTIDVVLHAIHFYERRNCFFDAMILLQPTSPLRSTEDLEAAINMFEKNESDSLISCTIDETLNDLIFYHRNGNFAIPLNHEHNKGVRRQDGEKIFIRNGAIYITKIKCMKETGHMFCDRPLMYVMPKNRSINVDTVEDLEIVRQLLHKKNSIRGIHE